MGDVFEDVQPRHSLGCEDLRRVRPVLLKRRCEDVAGLHFLPARALDVQDGRLQHSTERKRLLRLLVLPARELLDRIVQILVQILPQLRQVRAACGQDALAVGIVR